MTIEKVRLSTHTSSGHTKSLWSENSVTTRYSSSYYDYGVLDEFDHFLEVEILERYARTNATCLDLAAGNGRFTEALLNLGCHVTFVDLEEQHVQNAIRRFNNSRVEIVCADALQFLDTNTDKYDLIVLSGIILFLTDDQTKNLLSKARDRLSSTGIIFIRDFVAKKCPFAINSAIFEGATLHYRIKSFFQELEAEAFVISRPCHRLIGLEKFTANLIGLSMYKQIFRSELFKCLSWLGYGYKNMIFVIRK